MNRTRRSGLFLLLACGPGIFAAPAWPAPADTLVVCCAGDSLMRPIPSFFRDMGAGSGLALEIREWARGGQNTETYPAFFRGLRPEWEGQACDAILVQLGTNDAVPLLEERWSPAEFRTRMKGILAEFGKFPGRRRPRPLIFLATVPLFCDRPESAAKNRIVETIINPVLRDLAQAEGVVLVDNGAVLNHHPALYDPDCIHPGPDGSKALALNWLSALRRAFPEAVLRSSHPGARP